MRQPPFTATTQAVNSFGVIPLLQVTDIIKHFAGIYALQGVSFEILPGECVALVGENGAGKSTLMKILSGVWPQGSFSGNLSIDGNSIQLRGTLDGRRAGISIIHQELCLFSELTAAENLFLTEEYPYTGRPSQSLFSRVAWRELNRKAAAIFAELGFDVPAEEKLRTLSVAQCQLVEIARAFHQNARLLILDEPTSALSDSEVKNLFGVIRRMRERGMAFIYISHKLDEVFQVADRIVVLRDGKTVASLNPTETSPSEVVKYMVGRPLRDKARYRVTQNDRAAILEVEGLSHLSSAGKAILKGISFVLRQGEILGVAGLMGSGRSELLRSILGILPGRRSGIVRYEQKEKSWASMREALADGVAFVPEDRKRDGLFLDLSIAFNTSIGILEKFEMNHSVLNLDRESREVVRLCQAMGAKIHSPHDKVKNLSGGNQQKVLLARVVAGSPRVLFLDEPTRGIDVGAKEEIYDIIVKLAECGIAILLVSSELPEILSLADRILIMREGSTVEELDNVSLTQERVMAFSAGETHVC